MATLSYKEYREFRPSLRELWHRGGQYQKAAERVQALAARITHSYDSPFKGLKTTNHGENRVDKCVKYDLTGAVRLITIQDSSVVFLCFVGTHDGCDKWLEKKKGFRPVVDKGGTVTDTYVSDDISVDSLRVSGQSAMSRGKLYRKVGDDDIDLLFDGLDRKLMRQLEELESIHSDDDIYQLSLQINDGRQATAVFDVFSLLRQGKEDEADKRLKNYMGELREIDELPQTEIPSIKDSDAFKTIPVDSPHYLNLLEHYVKTADYKDWMLFLHPAQEEIVEKDFNGPTKLAGVSGSGKTCVVVKRAIRLAEKYQNEKILILTLNRPLAKLISDLVDAAALPGLRDQITVLPFFTLCQELLHGHEPENDKLYDDRTWKSEEHIDEIWREYYRCEVNNSDAHVMSLVHDSLIGRNINAEGYIREEFDWIRSAIPGKERDEYFKMKRTGRSYPLDKNYRSLLIDGLGHWESKMKAIGVTDYLGLATALDKYIDQIAPQYRCILVDESQDFGTSELALVRKLVAENENDLFLCGDAAQQVSSKHQAFRDAHVSVPSARSFTINKNYRNSKEILSAAYNVLASNIAEEMLDNENFEVLDPEYANFHGPDPLVLRANNLEEEISYAYAFLKECMGDGVDRKGCLAICGYSLYEVQEFGKKHGIAVLDGQITIDDTDIYLSDLEQTKGFEFDAVCIVNCNNPVIPDALKPEREQFRDLARFYVAMTRAKSQLVISYSSSLSKLILEAMDDFLNDDWQLYHEGETESVGKPVRLETLRQFDDEIVSDFDLSGPQFLFKHDAIGLPPLLIEKLRKQVSGKARRLNGVPVEWKTIRDAINDTGKLPQSRQQFGPEGIKLFRAFSEALMKMEERSVEVGT